MCSLAYIVKMKFILAVSEDNKIAIAGKLPWRIRHDMKWFKMNTYGGTVIMGRKTWDSIGKKALKGRKNIVVSRKKVPGVETITNLDRIKLYKKAYVIGGAELCQQLWKPGDTLILTRVHTTVPNGLGIELPDYKILWSKEFEGYTFSICKIV